MNAVGRSELVRLGSDDVVCRKDRAIGAIQGVTLRRSFAALACPCDTIERMFTSMDSP
jgi:hypothetical protein